MFATSALTELATSACGLLATTTFCISLPVSWLDTTGGEKSQADRAAVLVPGRTLFLGDFSFRAADQVADIAAVTPEENERNHDLDDNQ